MSQHAAYNSMPLCVVQSQYFGSKLLVGNIQIRLQRSTFLKKEPCCRNIEIVLHLRAISYVYIYIYIHMSARKQFNVKTLLQVKTINRLKINYVSKII